MIVGYSGIPYVDKGRSAEGCDCWGLVRLVMIHEAGIVLPLHTDIEPAATVRAARAIKRALNEEDWREVTDLPRRPLDVALMRRDFRASGEPTHFGIMVSPEILLHTEEAPGAHLAEIADAAIRCRLAGVYRHRGLP